MLVITLKLKLIHSSLFFLGGFVATILVILELIQVLYSFKEGLLTNYLLCT